MHDPTNWPMLEPVRSPSLSPHLHYQMNYRLPDWMTSLLHSFLVILLVDYIYILQLHTVKCYTYHQFVHTVVFTSLNDLVTPSQGKGVTIEWLLSWTESANKCKPVHAVAISWLCLADNESSMVTKQSSSPVGSYMYNSASTAVLPSQHRYCSVPKNR